MTNNNSIIFPVWLKNTFTARLWIDEFQSDAKHKPQGRLTWHWLNLSFRISSDTIIDR